MLHIPLNDEQLSRLLSFITESDEEFDQKYSMRDFSDQDSELSDSKD